MLTDSMPSTSNADDDDSRAKRHDSKRDDSKRHDSKRDDSMPTCHDELLIEIRKALLPPLQKIIVTYVTGHRWATDGPMHSPFIDIDIDGRAATPKPNLPRNQLFFGVFGQDVLAIAGLKWTFRSTNTRSQTMYLGFALWDEHIFSSGHHDTKYNAIGGVRILAGQIEVYGSHLLTAIFDPIVIPPNDEDEVQLTFQLVPTGRVAAHEVWLNILHTRVCLGETIIPLTQLVPYACFCSHPLDTVKFAPICIC